GRAEQDAVLHVGRLWSRERRYLDAHADGQRDPPAHGAVGLPGRSAAGLPGCHVRVAEVLCQPGATPGADGLKSAGTRRRQAGPNITAAIGSRTMPSSTAPASNAAPAMSTFRSIRFTPESPRASVESGMVRRGCQLASADEAAGFLAMSAMSAAAIRLPAM